MLFTIKKLHHFFRLSYLLNLLIITNASRLWPGYGIQYYYQF